jgi:hypothetical protein
VVKAPKESLKDKLKKQQTQNSKDAINTTLTGDDKKGVDPQDTIKLKHGPAHNGGGRSVILC